MNQRQLMKKHSQLLDETVELLSAVYNAYYASVTAFLEKTMISDGEVNPAFSQMYILSELNARKQQLEDKLQEIADTQMEEAFLLGFLFFELVTDAERKQSYTESVKKAEVVSALKQVAVDTNSRLSRVVKQSFQDKLMSDIDKRRSLAAINKLMQEKVSAEKFYRDIQKNGFVGYVDKAGRKWKPDTYARMLVRTKTMEANIGIQQEQGKQFGIDMAYIAGLTVDNPCNDWIGVLVSMNGLTPFLKTYEQVRATGEVFHPNCRHYLVPVRDLESCPDSVIAKTEQKYGINLREFAEN